MPRCLMKNVTEKDALTAQCALYNPVELLQYHVSKAILRLHQRLARVNRIQIQERI